MQSFYGVSNDKEINIKNNVDGSTSSYKIVSNRLIDDNIIELESDILNQPSQIGTNLILQPTWNNEND